jgi:hypothetical protein
MTNYSNNDIPNADKGLFFAIEIRSCNVRKTGQMNKNIFITE